MKVYVFGNEDFAQDNLAFEVADKLSNKIDSVSFIKIKPNEDLPFAGEEFVTILDAVAGIDEVRVIEDVDKFTLAPRSTVHDFDLAYQLKYLKKIGKLKKVVIIGLPMKDEEVDYLRIQSILRKLVAQDMQGS